MADESSVSKPAITGDVEIPEGAPTMAATPSVSKPDITGDVEIAAESPAPYTTSASSLPQSIGGRSGPPPRRASTTGEEGDVKLKIAGVAIDISEKQVPMLGMLLSSMVNVMAACLSVDPTHRYYEYAVSVGPVGMVLSSVGLLLSWKTTWDQGSLSKWISALCFLWSFIAAGVLTFGRGPFVSTLSLCGWCTICWASWRTSLTMISLLLLVLQYPRSRQETVIFRLGGWPCSVSKRW